MTQSYLRSANEQWWFARRWTGFKKTEECVIGAARNSKKLSTIMINNYKFSFYAHERHCEVCAKNKHLTSHSVWMAGFLEWILKLKYPQSTTWVRECITCLNLGGNDLDMLIFVQWLKNKLLARGDFDVEKEIQFFCSICIMGKQTRKMHPSVKAPNNFTPGKKIHTDVCRPINVKSPRGPRYFLLIKDECTCCR